jgi:hypothetical protein
MISKNIKAVIATALVAAASSVVLAGPADAAPAPVSQGTSFARSWR